MKWEDYLNYADVIERSCKGGCKSVRQLRDESYTDDNGTPCRYRSWHCDDCGNDIAELCKQMTWDVSPQEEPA